MIAPPLRPLALRLVGLAVLAGAALPALAQTAAPPTHYVRVDALGAVPASGLRTRFGPTGSAALGYGWTLAPGRTLELRVSGVRFPKGDVQFSPDTTGTASGPIDADSLDLSLRLVGGTVRLGQRLGQIGPASPRLVLGAGFQHWVDRRGAYPSRGLAEAQRRSQWSGVLEAGAGVDVPFGSRLALALDATYHLLPADLWRTQRVRLQAVNTFQYVTLGAGLRVALSGPGFE